MKKEEIKENETVEEQANQELVTVKGFNELGARRKTLQETFTNITDQKKIFNLDTNVDYKLNDCVGESIRVKEVLIKRFEKPMAEPELNEETGEIVKDKEIKMVTILIDDNDKSYVTASKIFTLQLMRYIEMFGITQMEKEGLTIKIVNVSVKNSNNKALGFELV